MFSSRFADKISSVSRQFLQHTCTVQLYIPSTDDEDAEYDETAGIECLFLWKETDRTDNDGTVTVKTPVLYVDASTPINEGSIVQDVTTPRGAVILNSARVTTIDTTAEGGNTALKVCTLSGATL